jgi:hypothetical protein
MKTLIAVAVVIIALQRGAIFAGTELSPDSKTRSRGQDNSILGGEASQMTAGGNRIVILGGFGNQIITGVGNLILGGKNNQSVTGSGTFR